MDERREQQPEMSVGELSRRAGVKASTVRFWDEHGLLSSRRTPGNQRRFDGVSLAQVLFIRWSQDVGASLDAIRDVLHKLPAGTAPGREVQVRAARCWREHLDQQRRELHARYRRLSQPLALHGVDTPDAAAT
ncbi:MerR family transcriptional regulator [Promicromonospora sp. NPDC050880]|uniref:MerR family transcriptional regulator n=1 Tax=Promicromonospora sp. NPDC050880 TaxID=3364406 RepID=UPI0037B6FE52